MAQGLGKHRPTFEDWELHLSTLFPEVRFKKNALELRMFDGNKPEILLAFSAMVKGLFYAENNMQRILNESWSQCWEDAQTLVEMAAVQLSPVEAEYLLPLHSLIAQRKTIGQAHADWLRSNPGDSQGLLNRLKL